MTSNSKCVRVGVLGLGRSGYDIHINGFRHMQDKFQVVAVYDPLMERMASVAEELGVKKCANENELINDPEVELVVVASPNLYHTEYAIRALEAGKHVLCEKPFGLTLDETDKMISTSRSAGKILQPFQQRRYEDDFVKVKEIYDSGILGRIYQVKICWHSFSRRWDWQTMRSCAGGALNNNGPHLIDYAVELFGEGDPKVWAEAKRCLCSGDAEDHLKIILYGEKHPTVDIELSSVYAYPRERWLICGSKGGLHGTASKLAWKWVDFSSMPERNVDMEPTPDRSYNGEELSWNEFFWKAVGNTDTGGGAAPAPKPVLCLYEGLYRSIREGAKQEISPESIRKRIAIMEKVRKFTGIPVCK